MGGLSGYGVWTNLPTIGEENSREAASLVEELGFTAFWLGGSPRIPQLRPLLEGSECLRVGSSVVNILGYEPAAAAAEWVALEDDFPGRVLLGLGVGHAEVDAAYGKPRTAMEAFLDRLDRAKRPVPRERRVLAALGPKMLDLAARRAAGSIPYFTSAEHTAAARQALGPGSLLAPELGCVVDSDRSRARPVAEKYARQYLRLANYARALASSGFSEAELLDGTSQVLLDAVVPYGDAETIAAVARAHRDAGADHVVLQAIGQDGIPRRQWTELARVLVGS